MDEYADIYYVDTRNANGVRDHRVQGGGARPTGSAAVPWRPVAPPPQAVYAQPQAPMYAQMLVGMVGYTGQWWLDAQKPSKEVVASHLVNLAWNGLAGLEKRPTIRSTSD